MDKVIVPISKNILEPIITTNIEYVDSLDEFEKIELQPNQPVLKFDNNLPSFYIKERYKFSEQTFEGLTDLEFKVIVYEII